MASEYNKKEQNRREVVAHDMILKKRPLSLVKKISGLTWVEMLRRGLVVKNPLTGEFIPAII